MEHSEFQTAGVQKQIDRISANCSLNNYTHLYPSLDEKSTISTFSYKCTMSSIQVQNRQ